MRWSLLFLFVAVCGHVACGGKTAAHPCEAGVAGQTISSGGISFVAKTAVATAAPGYGFVVASENACADRGAHLAVYVGTPATGTFTITRDKLAPTVANAILFSGAEAGTNEVFATSGSVRVITLDAPRRLVATYDLTFADGAHYTGGVDVPFCFNGDMCR